MRRKAKRPAAPKVVTQVVRLPLSMLMALREASEISGLTVEQLCLACLALAMVGSKR